MILEFTNVKVGRLFGKRVHKNLLSTIDMFHLIIPESSNIKVGKLSRKRVNKKK